MKIKRSKILEIIKEEYFKLLKDARVPVDKDEKAILKAIESAGFQIENYSTQYDPPQHAGTTAHCYFAKGKEIVRIDDAIKNLQQLKQSEKDLDIKIIQHLASLRFDVKRR